MKKAFTLIELLASVALVATLAVALGVALANTRQRAAAIRQTVEPACSQRQMLQVIRSELRFASAISLLTATEIIFTTPDPAGTATRSVRYYYDQAAARLDRTVNAGTPACLIPSVASVTFTAHILPGTARTLRGLTLTLCLASGETVQQYIDTINSPEVSGT